MTNILPKEVLDFWFSDTSKERWFNSTNEFDLIIKSKFENLWESAAAGELGYWKNDAESALALVIVLDQFPLNMFRGKTKSFTTESDAIEVAHYAITNNFDKNLTKIKLPFLYMPLMHSENLNDQILSVKLFKKAKLESNLRFAEHHREIIKQFGRFPHRNIILGRTSTNEELEYLATPKSI
ncbi:MAG: DUF924 family protein [Pseudomonadota bacterium]